MRFKVYKKKGKIDAKVLALFNLDSDKELNRVCIAVWNNLIHAIEYDKSEYSFPIFKNYKKHCYWFFA